MDISIITLGGAVVLAGENSPSAALQAIYWDVILFLFWNLPKWASRSPQSRLLCIYYTF